VVLELQQQCLVAWQQHVSQELHAAAVLPLRLQQPLVRAAARWLLLWEMHHRHYRQRAAETLVLPLRLANSAQKQIEN
jgi:hypothetical protein